MKSEQKIFNSYFLTTSGQNRRVDEEHYIRSVGGLTRRYGNWLPEKGADMLDLGCGLGELLYVCRDRAASLTGVNLCKEEIEIAGKFIPANFHNTDIISFLNKTQKSYDWIGCMNLLEHLSKDDILETLVLCSRHLRPGGTLVVMVPNALSPFSGTTRYWDFTHRIAFAPNNFRQLAPLSGFGQLEFKECGPIPHGIKSVIRWVLWGGLRSLIKIYLLIEVGDTKENVYTMDMLAKLNRID